MPPADGARRPTTSSRARRCLALIAAIAAGSACDGDRDANVPPEVVRGRAVHASKCLACHGPDPARPGPLGPEIAGASRDLLEARVVRGEYPPGYAPKRDTKLMPPMPEVASSVDDLAAFLAWPP
jgi:mono/diheme cytochrome c family protein